MALAHRPRDAPEARRRGGASPHHVPGPGGGGKGAATEGIPVAGPRRGTAAGAAPSGGDPDGRGPPRGAGGGARVPGGRPAWSRPPDPEGGGGPRKGEGDGGGGPSRGTGSETATPGRFGGVPPKPPPPAFRPPRRDRAYPELQADRLE